MVVDGSRAIVPGRISTCGPSESRSRPLASRCQVALNSRILQPCCGVAKVPLPGEAGAVYLHRMSPNPSQSGAKSTETPPTLAFHMVTPYMGGLFGLSPASCTLAHGSPVRVSVRQRLYLHSTCRQPSGMKLVADAM